jgi:hypothetical protein|tara:strand:- start:633 stop:854 length:222 start_codon:yes stop_codon:yes gene_type:complete
MKKWTGCDDAIVGLGHRCGCDTVVVYDYDKLVDVFIQQGMKEDESIEWIDFNILGAWIGEDTPIVLMENYDEH